MAPWHGLLYEYPYAICLYLLLFLPETLDENVDREKRQGATEDNSSLGCEVQAETVVAAWSGRVRVVCSISLFF